jgi:hypothetical protein
VTARVFVLSASEGGQGEFRNTSQSFLGPFKSFHSKQKLAISLSFVYIGCTYKVCTGKERQAAQRSGSEKRAMVSDWRLASGAA